MRIIALFVSFSLSVILILHFRILVMKKVVSITHPLYEVAFISWIVIVFILLYKLLTR